jgi:nitroreductase
LQQILNAALYAPNAMNQQKWHFTVIQNKHLLDRMVDIIKQNELNSGDEFLEKRAISPKYHTFYHAPTVILISAEENNASLKPNSRACLRKKSSSGGSLSTCPIKIVPKC